MPSRCLFVLLLCLTAFIRPAPAALQIAPGPNGLTSLQYNGAELLDKNGEFSGGFAVTGAVLRRPDGTTFDPNPYQNGKVSSDAANHMVTWTYPWAVASCAYDVAGDRLNLTLHVSNTGQNVVQGIALQPLAVRFPNAPKGWNEGWPYVGSNIGAPTVNVADYGTGVLAVCNDDLDWPLLAGFPGRQSSTSRPIVVASYNAIGWLTPMLDPYLNRPIYPGASDEYHVSLRFGPPGTSARALTSDLQDKFRAAHPFTLKWADHRPIGALFLSSSQTHGANNPRGWFNDKDADFTTDAGTARFKDKLMAYADSSIKILKNMNAQGMIVWDVEGQEYPHATSYLGDPRSLPPEMEPLADAFFQKFRDAGLSVGVCVRPQRPLRPAYAGEGVFQIEVPDPAQNLIDKIAYAKKRWGCTLFYVDSNGDPNVPFDAAIFERVMRAHPDVLLAPEQENTRYFASTAPFNSFFHQGVTSTPPSVRDIYPGAFSLIYAPDAPPGTTFAAHRAELLNAVKHGDILLFHGWYDNPNNAIIKGIYEEANRKG